MKTSKNSLAKNTIMMYLLTLSNQFFALMTVPYQTRVLGPVNYGTIAFCFSAMAYFQVVLDFGFTLSATAKISRQRNDKIAISRTTLSVVSAKLLLSAPCLLVLCVLCLSITTFAGNKQIFFVCFAYTFMNALIPDFLYRGMEDMKPITYRAVLTKLIFTCLVFLLVKKDSDYVLIPWIYFVGSLVAVGVAYVDVVRRFHLPLVSIRISNILTEIAESVPYFFSRIASTIYGATNTFVLGKLMPGTPQLGYYSSADKIYTIVRSAMSPITDSIYPYMVVKRDFKLAKKLLKLFMPVIIVGAAIGAIFAPNICTLLFGADYVEAATAVRALIPAMIVVLPNYMCGFPILSPMNLAKHANYSTIVGAAIHIIQIVILLCTSQFNIVTICIATSITECVILLYRVTVIYINRNNVKKATDSNLTINKED